MKNLLVSLTVLLAAAQTASAWPYAARQLPTGFSAPVINVVGAQNFCAKPVAVDYLSNGQPQWYGGGNVITKFPQSGVTTLPVITVNAGFPTAVKPITGIPCDVDRDGDPDIVRINTWDQWDHLNTFQVFLNQGGSFTTGYRLDWDPKVPAAIGAHLFQLAAGDFDRDGDQDVAVLQTYRYTNYDADPNRDEGALYIRWNDGTGGFGTATTIQTRGFSGDATLGAGDMDHDGDVDLACDHSTTWSSSDTYSFATRLYTNDGTGVFQASNLPAGHPASFVDLNRDGWLDMISGFAVAMNNGAGSMGSYYPAGISGRMLTVADANRDSLPDLIYASGNSLVYQSGDGSGGFSEGDTIATLAAAPAAASAADSDGDGDLDFLVTLSNNTSWFVENRSLHRLAGADLAGGAASIASVPGVTKLQTADFNLDGYEDLLAVAPSQEKLWFLFGEADGIPAAAVFKGTQSEAPHSAAVADFDRDGRTDVAYTLPATGQVRLARNTGNVPFSWSDSAIATGLTGVSLLVPGQHATPNGFTDLLTANGTNGQLRWLYQFSSAWQGQSVLNSFSPVPGSIMAVQATSGPGDEPFLLAASSSTLYLRGYQLTPTWVTAGTNRTEPVVSGPHTSAMIWADANRDGEKDAVFITATGALGVYNPITTARYDLGTSPAPLRDVAAVDWDRDGYQDFLCATANGLCLFRYSSGTSLWQRKDLMSRAGGFTSVVAMDLNRDLWMDAAAADTATGQVHFIRNAPRLLDAVVAPEASVSLPVGKSTNAVEFTAKSVGRTAGSTWLPDVDAVITRAEIQLRRAVGSGSSWTPGAALTQSELSAVATGISLTAFSTVIGSSGPAAISNGNLVINYNSVLGNLVPIAPGGTQNLGIRFTVPAGALSAPVTRFFVSLKSIHGYAQDGISSAQIIPLSYSGANPALVTIVPDYTPLQWWRVNHFGAPDGTGLRANDADYDKDGETNLVEYLTGTNPTLPETALNAANGLSLLPTASPQALVKFRLVMDNAALSDSRLRVTIQQSTGLNVWVTQTSRTGGTSWSGSQPVIAVGSTHTTLVFTPGFTPLNNPRLFFRLKAEELP
jgi:FG-GAP-like repeat